MDKQETICTNKYSFVKYTEPCLNQKLNKPESFKTEL